MRATYGSSPPRYSRPDDTGQALLEMRRLVRPGGQLIAVDVVDDRRQVPRAWLRREAVRTLWDDLRTRRRTAGEAWELLGLQLARSGSIIRRPTG